MSGTYDFIDEAVEQLRKGEHAFVVIALSDGPKPDEYRWSIRIGERNTLDMDRLERIVRDKLPEELRNARNG